MDMTTKEEKKLQDKLIVNVAEEIQLSRSYILLLVFSVIIATLGLLIDSAAVVIGAMLISPLFWPLMGLTVGIFTTRRKLAGRSLLNIGVSLLLALIVATLIGWVTPIADVTGEIQARLQPTIIDLFIALASAVIGVAAIYYPRISQTATGVAMSIALLPPLCVSGLGIAMGSWEIFWRAGLLFGTNVVAIIFAGLITLYFLRFRPHRRVETERFRIGLAVSFVMLVLLSIPLSIYLRDSLRQNQVQRDVRDALIEQVAFVNELASVDEVEVDYIPSVDSEVTVSATIYLPEGDFFTVAEQNVIVEYLASRVGATVDMQLNVVNTLQLRKEDDEEMRERRTEVSQLLREELSAMSPDSVVASTDIVFAGEVEGVEETTIELLLHLQEEVPFTFDQKETLRTTLEEKTDESIELEVEFIEVQRITKPSDQKKLESQVERVLEQSIDELFAGVELETVVAEAKKKKIMVTAIVRAPIDYVITPSDQSTIENYLTRELEEAVEFELQIERYELPAESESAEGEEETEQAQ